jgi:hypothetical protein
MYNTYIFDDYTVKLNDKCEVYLDGKVSYLATWEDGTTSTHYGNMNCHMELKDVQIEELDIASYSMMTKVGTSGKVGSDWIITADVDCFAFANGGSKELMTWLEEKLKNDGVFEGDIMVHAESQGAPDPEDHALSSCGDDPHGDK